MKVPKPFLENCASIDRLDCNAPFPLTPALSLGERVKLIYALRCSRARRLIQRLF